MARSRLTTLQESTPQLPAMPLDFYFSHKPPKLFVANEHKFQKTRITGGLRFKGKTETGSEINNE
jgi:hypothetical protein